MKLIFKQLLYIAFILIYCSTIASENNDNHKKDTLLHSSENKAIPLKTKQLHFPEVAKKRGIQADVYLQFDITTQGKPTNIKILDIHLSHTQNSSFIFNDFSLRFFINLFNQTSINNIKKWKFKIKRHNGKRILQKNMRFTLNYRELSDYKLPKKDVSITIKHGNNIIIQLHEESYPEFAYLKGIQSNIPFKVSGTVESKMDFANIVIKDSDGKVLKNESHNLFFNQLFQEKATMMIKQHYIKSNILNNIPQLRKGTHYSLHFDLSSSKNQLNDDKKTVAPNLPISNQIYREALDNNIIGSVTYQFDINKNGLAKNIKMINIHATKKDKTPLNIKQEHVFFQKFYIRSLIYIQNKFFNKTYVETQTTSKNVIYKIQYNHSIEKDHNVSLKDNGAIPIKTFPPSYPQIAIKNKLVATITLKFNISRKGKPIFIEVSAVNVVKKGSNQIIHDKKYINAFIESTLSAIKKWRFKTKKIGGNSIMQENMNYTLKFQLP